MPVCARNGCGETFPVTRGRPRLTCSDRCRRLHFEAAKREQVSKDLVETTLDCANPNCSKTFTLPGRAERGMRRRYCSVVCRRVVGRAQELVTRKLVRKMRPVNVKRHCQMRKCRVCKSAILTGAYKYCSADCKLTSKKAKPRRCVECNALVAASNGKYCSKPCHLAARRKKQRKDNSEVVIECRFCKEGFSPVTNLLQRYCSNDCRKAQNKRIKRHARTLILLEAKKRATVKRRAANKLASKKMAASVVRGAESSKPKPAAVYLPKEHTVKCDCLDCVNMSVILTDAAGTVMRSADGWEVSKLGRDSFFAMCGDCIVKGDARQIVAESAPKPETCQLRRCRRCNRSFSVETTGSRHRARQTCSDSCRYAITQSNIRAYNRSQGRSTPDPRSVPLMLPEFV